ncbi:MAG: stage III sporulation protein AB [Oscillospiraceae bacterium]|nr:stage III sporulation protein AB [Oscillospiraceae bacterium]
MHSGLLSAAALLPPELADALGRLGGLERCEEIRLRCGRRPSARIDGEERPFHAERAGRRWLDYTLNAATRSSFHTYAGQLREGFVCTAEGVRVGVCGSAADGEICAVRDVTGIAIRVPRQVREAGAAAAERIVAEGASALIISPPGGGKTTFLRELIRRASDAGRCVAAADERGELAGEGFDLGRCTDVMSFMPKARAAVLMLRAMSPDIVAMDELTAPGDAEAALGCFGCGVGVYATAHAGSLEELRRRSVYRPLLECGAFGALVVISGVGAERRYEVQQL